MSIKSDILNEIKPCPFCGGTKIKQSIKVGSHNYSHHSYSYRSCLYCSDCNTYGPRVITRVSKNSYDVWAKVHKDTELLNNAIGAWNTRS